MKKLLILTAGVAAGTIAWAPMAHADDAPTDTTVAEAPAPQSPIQISEDYELPDTGSSTTLVMVGLGALGAGATVLVATRRRQPA